MKNIKITYVGNPQTENGYVRIANELYDALLSTDLTKLELKVILFIMRITYGWNKKEVDISSGEISRGTGLDSGNIRKTLTSLEDKKIITRVIAANKQYSTLTLNKRYLEWDTTIFNKELFEYITVSNAKVAIQNNIPLNSTHVNNSTRVELKGSGDSTHENIDKAVLNSETNTCYNTTDFQGNQHELDEKNSISISIPEGSSVQIDNKDNNTYPRLPLRSTRPPRSAQDLAPLAPDPKTTLPGGWPLSRELMDKFDQVTWGMGFINRSKKTFVRPAGWTIMCKELQKFVEQFGPINVESTMKDLLENQLDRFFYMYDGEDWVDVNLGYLFVTLKNKYPGGTSGKSYSPRRDPAQIDGKLTLAQLISLPKEEFNTAARTKTLDVPKDTQFTVIALMKALHAGLFVDLPDRYSKALDKALSSKSIRCLNYLGTVLSYELNCDVDATELLNAVESGVAERMQLSAKFLKGLNSSKVYDSCGYANPLS